MVADPSFPLFPFVGDGEMTAGEDGPLGRRISRHRIVLGVARGTNG